MIVTNLDEAAAFARSHGARLTDQSGVEWLCRAFRAFVPKHRPCLEQVAGQLNHSQELVRRAIANGEPVYRFVSTPEFAGTFGQVVDWMAALEEVRPDLVRKLPRVTFDQALEASRRWHAALARRAERARRKVTDDPNGLELVLDCGSGLRWVKLLTPAAKHYEGACMGHCVGTEGYEDTEIWSLRDSRNQPHCTVQTEDKWIVQLSGRANAQPSKRYWPAIEAFVAWFEPERFDDAVCVDRFFAEGKLWPSPDAFFEDVTALPRIVRGDVHLTGATVTRLPDGLHVEGNLFLSGASITRLPPGLCVDGSLYLRYIPITCLPERLHVSGSLDLLGTRITELPNAMRVGGTLDLTNTLISQLPEGLHVEGSLFLGGTPITQLPNELVVQGTLGLKDTLVSVLPEELQVSQSLYLENTKITRIPEALRNIEGSLELRSTPITHLPTGLRVSQYLDLSYTPITQLPEGLAVGGSCNLSHSQVAALPEGLTVARSLDLSHTPITRLPEDLVVGADLDLTGTLITALPADLRVGGKIIPPEGRSIETMHATTHRSSHGKTILRGVRKRVALWLSLLSFLAVAGAAGYGLSATPDESGIALAKVQPPPTVAQTDPLTQHALEKFGNLTQCEREVLHAVSNGLVAQCGPDDPKNPAFDPAKGQTWGAERSVRANLLRWLFVDPQAAKYIDPGGILIEGAHFGGQLNLQGLKLPFSLILNNCFMPSGITMTSARIGFFAMQNVWSGPVDAPSLRSNGSFLIRDGTITGFLQLSGAQINGALNLMGARILTGGMKGIEKTVDANAVRIGGAVNFHHGFTTDGLVSMNEAKIFGDFALQDSRFLGTGPNGLLMERSSVQGVFWWFRNVLTRSTVLDLDETTTATLRDDVSSWPAPGKLYIDGFTYGRIDCFNRDKGCAVDARQRLDWIRLQAYDSFHPQPYRQLAKVLQDLGDNAGATRVLIAAQDDARVNGRLTWPSWISSWILKLTVGYGYEPQRALYWAAFLVVVGGVLVRLGHQAGVMKPVSEDGRMAPPLIYSLDVFLPIVDLRLQHDWWPDPSAKGVCRLFGYQFTFYGSFLRAYLWCHIVAGWVLSTLFIAGLSGLIHQA
jgi:Leucine-rich repeat (LRR) protein